MAELYDLVVVGAGISALAFLRALPSLDRRDRSLVVDHRAEVGGFLGVALPAEEFPEESALLGEFRLPASVELRLATTAVGLIPGGAGTPPTILLRDAGGSSQVAARRVVIASGSLERPREQDAVPGTRPAGVMTPVLVHQLLAAGYLPGRRTVVYGAGRAAALVARRLVAAGSAVTLVPPPGAVEPGVADGVRTLPPATIAAVAGQARLERVALRRGERSEEIPADTLVYAVGALPNTLWLKGSGIDLNGDGAIRVDGRCETSLLGVSAIGTVVDPSPDHAGSVAAGQMAARAMGGER